MGVQTLAHASNIKYEVTLILVEKIIFKIGLQQRLCYFLTSCNLVSKPWDILLESIMCLSILCISIQAYFVGCLVLGTDGSSYTAVVILQSPEADILFYTYSHKNKLLLLQHSFEFYCMSIITLIWISVFYSHCLQMISYSSVNEQLLN